MLLHYFGMVLVGCLATQSAVIHFTIPSERFLSFRLEMQAIPQGRVVNGNIAANYQFPWHVSLTVYTNTGTGYCGGSLISSRFVLTAATCVVNAMTIKVDYGSIQFSRPLETQNTTNFMVHPHFSPIYNLNNIAIIRLNNEVYYTNDKRAVMLAGQSKASNSFVNTTSYISGFGVSQNGKYVLSITSNRF